MGYEEELFDKVFQIDQYNLNVWKKNRQPLVATFELLPNCNLSCIHCYLGKHRVDEKVLTTKQVKKILDQLADAGVLHLALTGGECTLRSDIVEIYTYAKKKGFLVTLFTNGVTIPDDLFHIFKLLPPFFVDISLYGASEDTYELITGKRVFGKVIETLDRLKKEGIVFGIKTPIINKNKNDLEKMQRIADRYSVTYRTGYVMTPTIDNEQYPKEFMVSMKEMISYEVSDKVKAEIGFKDADVVNPWGEKFDRGEFVPLFICNPGVNDVIIDYKGNVCPCAGFRHIGKNIFESSFKKIWDDFSYLKKIPATEKNKCMRCQSRYFCRVCPAEQEMLTGDLESVNKNVCDFANAKKMYYKDGIQVDEIIKFMSNENE